MEVSTHTGISDDLLPDKSSPRDFHTHAHKLLLVSGSWGVIWQVGYHWDPGRWEYGGADLSGYIKVTEVSWTTQCIYTLSALSCREVIFHHLSAGFSHACSKSLHGLSLYIVPSLPRVLCDVLLRWKESGAHHYKSAC